MEHRSFKISVGRNLIFTFKKKYCEKRLLIRTCRVLHKIVRGKHALILIIQQILIFRISNIGVLSFLKLGKRLFNVRRVIFSSVYVHSGGKLLSHE